MKKLTQEIMNRNTDLAWCIQNSNSNLKISERSNASFLIIKPMVRFGLSDEVKECIKFCKKNGAIIFDIFPDELRQMAKKAIELEEEEGANGSEEDIRETELLLQTIMAVANNPLPKNVALTPRYSDQCVDITWKGEPSGYFYTRESRLFENLERKITDLKFMNQVDELVEGTSLKLSHHKHTSDFSIEGTSDNMYTGTIIEENERESYIRKVKRILEGEGKLNENKQLAEEGFKQFGGDVHIVVSVDAYSVSAYVKGKTFHKRNEPIRNLKSDIYRFKLIMEKHLESAA